MEEMLGHRLRRDILNRVGIVIVPSHTVLEREHIEKLHQHHILLSPDDFVQEDTATCENLISRASLEIKEVFEMTRFQGVVPFTEISNHIIPSIQLTAEHRDLFDLLSGIQEKDDYTYRHNIGVAVFATILGRWLNLSKEELKQLSIAATLHDIGKVKIPQEILNKPGRLTQEEYELMKKHTTFGYEILKNTSEATHEMALVALQHHERDDGRGYPLGETGHDVLRLSRIVAVADVFHAMTSNRPYRKAIPFYKVIAQMHDDIFGVLDPGITSVFLNRLMSMSIGSEVVLSDGRKGKLVYINPTNPIKPLIRLDEGFIDLSKEQSIQLQNIIG